MKKYDVVCLGCIVEDIVLTSVPRDTFYHDTTVAGSGLVSTGGDATNEAVTLILFPTSLRIQLILL